MDTRKNIDRIHNLCGHLAPSEKSIQLVPVKAEEQEAQAKTATNSLSIVDNRTGKSYNIPVKDGNLVAATELGAIKNSQGTGLRSYDPGFMNTSICKSRVCFIDGEKGILTYRGYPIEQLAERSSFLEVAFLLIYGDLPNSQEFTAWQDKIMTHTYCHENLNTLMQSFRYDAHPMGMFITGLAAMGTFHPESNPALSGANVYDDPGTVNKQIHRLIGKATTIAANAYRHRIGRPYNRPLTSGGYCENFLYMLDALSDSSYRPHPTLVRALDILFILHAEHELNCSTAAMRHLASSGVDVFTAAAGAAGALYGPSHGGANEAVLRMLESIGTVENIPQFLQDVKNRKKKLMGFGHRIYKNYDPRAKIIRRVADEVFGVVGRSPLIDLAMELERIALSDEYFIKRKLYPNVDFYTGIIYKAMGFPTDMFPVLFAIPRIVGWLAHWVEQLRDPETKIVRPRQDYRGPEPREYRSVIERSNVSDRLYSYETPASIRRNAALRAKDSLGGTKFF